MSNVIWGIINGACLGFLLCCIVYWDAISMIGTSGSAMGLSFGEAITALVVQGKMEQYIGLGALLGALAGLAYNQSQANKPKEASKDE